MQVRLEDVRDMLITCNEDVFGNVYHRKRRVLARLKGTQIALHNHCFRPSSMTSSVRLREN